MYYCMYCKKIMKKNTCPFLVVVVVVGVGSYAVGGGGGHICVH